MRGKMLSLTLSAMAKSRRPEGARRRSNSVRDLHGGGGPRGRWRRLRGYSARLLAGGDEDEGGQASRQIGSARGVQWPRGCGDVLRRELWAANKTAKGEGEDE